MKSTGVECWEMRHSHGIVFGCGRQSGMMAEVKGKEVKVAVL